jgi:hypothetical protein
VYCAPVLRSGWYGAVCNPSNDDRHLCPEQDADSPRRRSVLSERTATTRVDVAAPRPHHRAPPTRQIRIPLGPRTRARATPSRFDLIASACSTRAGGAGWIGRCSFLALAARDGSSMCMRPMWWRRRARCGRACASSVGFVDRLPAVHWIGAYGGNSSLLWKFIC